MVTFLGLEVTLTNGEPSANFISGIYRCDGNYSLNDPVLISFDKEEKMNICLINIEMRQRKCPKVIVSTFNINSCKGLFLRPCWALHIKRIKKKDYSGVPLAHLSHLLKEIGS